VNFQFLIPPWLLASIGAVGLAFIVLGLLSGRERLVAWLRRAAMLLMVVAMGLAPAVVIKTTTTTSNLAVYFVIDATGSMAAEDYDGDKQRLEGVRADALALVQTLPSAHYSIIEYSSTATQQLPLTSDKQAVVTWLEVYDRELTDYSAGSSINRPVETVAEIVGERANPGYAPIIILMTDGESTDTSHTERGEAPNFGAWNGLFEGGMVLGYGTEQGAPMIRKESWRTTDEYIDDPAGGTAISRADTGALETVANQIGVPFYHRTSPGGIEDIAGSIDADAILADSVDESTYSPIIWPFAIIFAVLMAWEISHLVPHVRVIGMLSTRRQTMDVRPGHIDRSADGSPRVRLGDGPDPGSSASVQRGRRWAGRR